VADESEVEDALAGVIAATIYPNGTSAASALLSAAGCRVYRGWPVEANLKSDLARGTANISVFARNGVEIVATRYPPERREISRQAITLTATVSDNTITIDGIVRLPQTIMVRVGHAISVAYAVQVGDTLISIATGIATLLAAQVPGTASGGPVVTLPTSAHAGLITARVTTMGQVAREVKRTDKSFQISLWSPTPQLRDSMAKVVDPALGDLRTIMLPDGSVGWNRYEYTIVMDTPSEEGLYRRDLFYRVEFPTLIVEDAYEIGVVQTNLTGSQEDPFQPPAQTTPVVPIVTTR
jgi:hypothetical protein